MSKTYTISLPLLKGRTYKVSASDSTSGNSASESFTVADDMEDIALYIATPVITDVSFSGSYWYEEGALADFDAERSVTEITVQYLSYSVVVTYSDGTIETITLTQDSMSSGNAECHFYSGEIENEYNFETREVLAHVDNDPINVDESTGTITLNVENVSTTAKSYGRVAMNITYTADDGTVYTSSYFTPTDDGSNTVVVFPANDDYWLLTSIGLVYDSATISSIDMTLSPTLRLNYSVYNLDGVVSNTLIEEADTDAIADESYGVSSSDAESYGLSGYDNFELQFGFVDSDDLDGDSSTSSGYFSIDSGSGVVTMSTLALSTATVRCMIADGFTAYGSTGQTDVSGMYATATVNCELGTDSGTIDSVTYSVSGSLYCTSLPTASTAAVASTEVEEDGTVDGNTNTDTDDLISDDIASAAYSCQIILTIEGTEYTIYENSALVPSDDSIWLISENELFTTTEDTTYTATVTAVLAGTSYSASDTVTIYPSTNINVYITESGVTAATTNNS